MSCITAELTLFNAQGSITPQGSPSASVSCESSVKASMEIASQASPSLAVERLFEVSLGISQPMRCSLTVEGAKIPTLEFYSKVSADFSISGAIRPELTLPTVGGRLTVDKSASATVTMPVIPQLYFTFDDAEYALQHMCVEMVSSCFDGGYWAEEMPWREDASWGESN